MGAERRKKMCLSGRSNKRFLGDEAFVETVARATEKDVDQGAESKL